MSPFAVQVLRRVALFAGAAAALLAGVPWVLSWAGVLGPTPQEDIRVAEHSLNAARSFGAREGEAPFAGALSALEQARQLLQAGKPREARRAAALARDLGVEAQRKALGTRDASRRQAQAAVHDVDGLLNALEDLYDERAPELSEAEQSRLLTLMKEARESGGALFLAFDQAQYGRVLDLQGNCLDKLAQTKAELQAAKRR